MKPFFAHLLEAEDTYEYKLISVENIHTEDVIRQLKLALGKYGLINIKNNGVNTKIQDGTNFTDYPFKPVYISTITLSGPLSSKPAVQSIALFTRIKDNKLKFLDKNDKIVTDGMDGEQHAHPIEVDSKDAQSEVGQAHADSLVSDLMKGIAGIRKDNIIRDVYEGHVTSHREISQMLGKPVMRGFYLVENNGDGTGYVVGPYKKCPDNYNYQDTTQHVSIITETKSDEVIEYSVKFPEAEMQKDPDDAGVRDRGKPMEVKMVDQDTGKEHSVVVRAVSDEAARIKAVEIIASRTGLHKDRFIPMNPTPS